MGRAAARYPASKLREVTVRSRPMLAPLLALLFAGLAFYGARGSIGNFVLPWEGAYGASRGDVSLIATVSFLAIGLAQPIAGRLLETVAAWKLLALGLTLGLVGYGGGAFAPNLLSAVVLVGAVGGFGGGLAANSTLSVMVTQLFRERQGAMFGLIGAATAGGTMLLIPASSGMIDGISRRAGLLFLAGSLALALLGVVLFLRAAGGGEAYTRPAERVTVAGALHVRDFWLLAIPFFVCGITSTGITDPHLIPYMQGCHIGNGTASTIAAALAGFNVLGTLASGILSDRLDQRKMLAFIYLLRGVTLLLLPLLRSTELLAAFAVVYGLADFSTVPPTTKLAKSSFRNGGWALVLGLLGTAHQLGSALGGALGGFLYDQTGGYGLFFVISATTCIVAAALSLGIGRAEPRVLVPAPAPA